MVVFVVLGREDLNRTNMVPYVILDHDFALPLHYVAAEIPVDPWL